MRATVRVPSASASARTSGRGGRLARATGERSRTVAGAAKPEDGVSNSRNGHPPEALDGPKLDARRLAEAMRDGTKTRNRWSSEFWTEVECDTTEPWMMGNDQEQGGALRSNFLLSPAWRLMLLSDGSVTRHLKLLTGRVDVKTDVLWQGKVDCSAAGAWANGVPADVVNKLGGSSLLQREVDLCDAHGSPLCYAASWWNLNNADNIILDEGADNAFGALDRPVWLKLAENKTELFREVRRVYRGTSEVLSTAWDLPITTAFWARHYIFWCGRKPLCVIHEVMSPRLEAHLGPSEPAAPSRRSFNPPPDDVWP